MADGSLIFDTGLDNSGFTKGIASLKTSAVAAAVAVTAAFTVAAGAAVSVGNSFSTAMSQVGATMGITRASEDYALLADAAEDMGAKTKYSATQAGEALNYLALAGYDAQKSVAALPTVLNVAAAGGIDLAYASDMITDSMSALGLSMAELESFSDKLAKTSQKSNTSVAQLGEAILTVGGTAKTLSGGVTELNTLLGLIADNGIKGAEGGTALRNIILSLSAPTDTAAEAMERLNVSAFDGTGRMRELSEVFADFNAALAPLSEQAKTQTLSEIFNKVDLKAVNALLGTSAERFDQLTGYIENSAGAAAQMADTMSDNLQGDIDNFESALEGVGITAYNKFEQPMRTALQSVTEDISALNLEMKDGRLSESFDTISESVGNFSEEAGDFITDTLPVMIDGMADIVEHGDDIVTTLTAVGAAVVVFKGLTVFSGFQQSISIANLKLLELEARSGSAAVSQAFLSGSLKKTEVAAGIFSGKINAATVATAGFQAVANSPILLTAILAGIVVAVAKYTTSLAEATEITKAAAEAAEDYNAALKQQEEQISDNNAALEADKSNLMNKIAIYGQLREQYEETGKGEQELIEITKEIQALSPTTIQFVDEETQKYLSLAGAVDNVVAAMERKRQLENAESEWNFAANELPELYKQRQLLIDERTQLESAFKDKYGISSDNAGLANTIFAYSPFETVAIGYAKNRINKNEAAILELNEAIADAESRSANAVKTINELYLGDGAVVPESSADSWSEQVSEYITASAKTALDTTVAEVTEAQQAATAKLEEGFKKLDHDFATGVITSESELYQRKRALVADYGNAELEDHWSFYEELYSYEKSFTEESARLEEERLNAAKEKSEAAQEMLIDNLKSGYANQLDTVRTGISDIVSEYKTAMSELESNISGYRNKLLSVGDIFSVEESEENGVKTRTYTIENVRKQMDEMRKYHDYIKQLKASGASEGLLSELTSLDFEDGAQFGKYLTGLSDTEFTQINNYYKERDRLADELSQDLYAGEAEKINSALTASVDKALEQLPVQAQEAGKQMLSGILAGMDMSREDLSEEISSFADSFSELYNAALEEMDLEHGFSVVLGGMNTYSIGQSLARDFAAGFNAELEKNRAEIRIQQSAAAADLTSGSPAAVSDSSVKSGSEKITVETTNNVTVMVDGDKLTSTVQKKIEEKERRMG